MLQVGGGFGSVEAFLKLMLGDPFLGGPFALLIAQILLAFG